MALIKCPDCGKAVSDAAPACPDCARPMAQASAATAQRVVTTEDSALTRNRGCADLIIWPFLLLLVVGGIAVAAGSCSS